MENIDSIKNMKRRIRRAKMRAFRYMSTTHPFRPLGGEWGIHRNYYGSDYTQMWIKFYDEKGISIIDGKFPEIFPKHLAKEMKIDKKIFPQLCYA